MSRFITAPPPDISRKLSHVVPLLVVTLVACGGGEPRAARSSGLSREPISVRGWIADVERPANDTSLRTVETDAARRAEMFGATTVWVEDAPYVSGGVAENGSFILLDVPPGNVTITFTAPGVESSALKLEGVPGNADVLVPGIVLKRTGAAPIDLKAVKVRMPAKIDQPRPTGQSVRVSGQPVPVIDTPLAQLVDRRDYPVPPGIAPLATVR